MTVAEIKALYPNPMAFPIHREEDEGDLDGLYCIGGALGFMLGFEDGFPTTDDVATYLEMANGNLDQEWAAGFAEDITQHNDDGAFDEAWADLALALEFEPEPE